MSIPRRIFRTPRIVFAVLFLASCAGPAPLHHAGAPADDLWTRSMRAGRAAFERGDLDSAARFYQEALSRGRTMDAAPAIADAAYNLAACRTAQGEYDSARALLREARAEMARAGGEPAPDVLLVEARVVWLQGETEEALSLVGKLLATPPARFPEELQLQALLLRGKVACSRGDAERAAADLALVEKTVRDDDNPAVRAGRSGLAGCISLSEGKAAAAARHFDREADHFREAGQYRGMADALHRAGGAYELASLKKEAAERFFRAARAVFTLGDPSRARDLAQKALGAGSEAKDGTLQERTRALLEEIAAADTGRK